MGPDPLSTDLGGSAIYGAAQWIQAALLGSLATTVAVIAVAFVGVAMLAGRIDLRRGATIVVGCFILFGAPTIAAGLMRASELSGTAADVAVVVAAPPPPPPPTVVPPSTPYDPYAGASVPSRR